MNINFKISKPRLSSNFSQFQYEVCNSLFHWSRTFPRIKKFVEFEIYSTNYSTNLIDLQIYSNSKSDHAGIGIYLNILKYTAQFDFRDSRHWDINNNCWKD